MPLFRELFPGEVLAPGQLATVSTVTLLFTSLDPATADALYRELGDARAFGMIHEHLQKTGQCHPPWRRAVIKTMGEGVLASFSQVTAAVETALSLAGAARPRRAFLARAACASAFTEGPRWPPRSTTSSTTSEQPPAMSSPSSSQARDGELVLTQAVAADPEVAALLNEPRHRDRDRADVACRPSAFDPRPTRNVPAGVAV